MRFTREWVGAALVVLGLVRAALLVAHVPMVAYANQYDMVRTSACTGFFPAIDAPARYQRHPDAPIALYRLEAGRPDLCYRSTEVAIDSAVAAIAAVAKPSADGLPIQWIGYAKLALLAITAFALAWALHRHPTGALLHGIVFAFVICDPLVTLWFNTLYTEFAALWGIYAVIGACAALAVSSRGAYMVAVILLVALVALAFSREQFALLALLLPAAAFPWLWARSPHLAVAAFGVALVSSLISFALIPRPTAIATVNRVDTYLGVVLPAATSPLRALAALGLPARCQPAIGMSWYLRRGESLEDICPEVTRLGSLAFLRLASADADALARSLARVAPATQEMAPVLGTLAGDRRVLLNELPWWLRSPLHAVSWRTPVVAYSCWLVVLIVSLPLAVLAALAWARPARDEGASLLVAMMLSGTVAYALLTTVFGDGMSEASRHFLPGHLAAIVALIALIVMLPESVNEWWVDPRARGFQIAAAIGSVIITLVATAVAIRWARDQPLSVGLLDEPTGRTFTPGASIPLRGWALDPFGVDSVTVDLAGLAIDAKYGSDSYTLKQVFPGYPDSGHGNFTASISAADLARASAAGPPTLRVLVKSRTGAITKIDRRRLEPAP
ncbi:MAG TPA: hypothetical protein VLJ84_04975 [Usitatibacter sp.]|nr:hypothetical protein [Usitatibacter sp.]